MVKSVERYFFGEPFDSVRALWISRARAESGRRVDSEKIMRENEFELVDADVDSLLLDDGREILRAHGKAWALRPEIHAQRLAVALELAQQRDAVIKSQNQAAETSGSPTICTSLIDGQLCGGVLSATSVCPKCALGKQGVAQIMTCDVCGAQTAVMR